MELVPLTLTPLVTLDMVALLPGIVAVLALGALVEVVLKKVDVVVQGQGGRGGGFGGGQSGHLGLGGAGSTGMVGSGGGRGSGGLGGGGHGVGNHANQGASGQAAGNPAGGHDHVGNICSLWNAGQCKYGQNCKFSHKCSRITATGAICGQSHKSKDH